MSSKKLFYFLAVSLICGLIAGGVAHAQVQSIGGVVTDADGTPVAGATVRAPDFASVFGQDITDITDENGDYEIPYINLSNTPINAGDQIEVIVTTADGDNFEETHTVKAEDISAGKATFNIKLVSTIVTVAVSPASFMADTIGTGAITVTVSFKEEPVTDENVTLRLSPNVGTVSSPATNNGDGTYSATYTSGTAAGNVTITATATESKVSGMATVAINAGPPAAITLTASPDTVSSLGSATITAMVTDSNGNGVGGASLIGMASGSGAVGAFTADAKFGSYTATYTAPMVDAEGTEMITVSTDGVSADVTLNLTPEPPIEVNLLVIEGIVYKADGGVPADGVTATVTVGSNAPETRTTAADGGFEVTLLDPLAPVARTGDLVSIVVTDAAGVERGSTQLPLTNDRLDGTAVMVSVTTDIVVPPRSVSVLVIEGMVSKEDGTTSVGGGLNVTVTVGSMSDTVQTSADGAYSVAFVGATAPVAVTGDPVSIVASDGSGERGRVEFALSNVQLGTTGSAKVPQNITTDIGLTTNVLAIVGTVYLKNGDSPIAASNDLREGQLSITATNTTRNLSVVGAVDDDGGYDITFLGATAAVAETGDVITVEVSNDAGEAVGSESHTITIADLQTPLLTLDVKTSEPAQIRVLNIAGTVVETDGSPVAAGLPVTITIEHADGTSTVAPSIVTDAMGGYEHLFLDLVNPVAATGDTLMIDVLRASDQFLGHGSVPLSSHDLAASRTQQLMIDPVTMVPPRLELGGLSINPSYTGIQDPTILDLLNADLVGLVAAAGALVGDDASGNPLVTLPPSLPLLLSPILAAIGAFQVELPSGFDPTNEHIAKESFGNAITTRPTAWAALSADARDTGRWVTGDQLNLYISGAPTIESVTFTLNGMPMSATSVPAGGSFMYNFQLKEDLIGLLSGEMPAFASVELRIDGQMPMAMAPDNMGGWSVDVALRPGDTVAYYYWVVLSQPYHDTGLTVKAFAHIDPQNRQLITDGLSETIEGLLDSELSELKNVRSVFHVPEVNNLQSLWVAPLPLDTDGAYQLDTTVVYRGGHTDSVNGQMFTVDRTPPTTDVALNPNAPGMNAGLYMRDDGSYVATGPMPGEASLTVSTMGATSNEPDGTGYIFQLAKLDGAGNPGAWNPVVKSDLLPLDLDKLLTNPASVLPLTGGGPIEMLIRNSEGGRLMGAYGLRAVGVDSLLNVDSSRGHSVVVNFVPPDPNIVEVSYVTADFDGNDAIEGLEMQSTAGDVVVFSDSLITLTVDVLERTHPFTSIVIEVEMPGFGSLPVATFTADQLATTMMGDQFTQSVAVPDIPGLPDRGSRAIVRTVTTNALNVVNRHEVEVAYERRLPPEVSAIYADVTDRNPDSGAAQGLITVSAFTQAMTNPGIVAVQLEARRAADAEWMPIGIVQIANSKVTSHVQVAIIEDLVNAIVGGAPTAPISALYREWPLTIDSAMLEDTIMDDSPAASDASLDENPYVLRAIAVDKAAARYESADGVTDGFSLDNYSPTAIAQVAYAEDDDMVMQRDDGSYYVSGLIAEGVADPMLTLTASTGAHPNAFMGGLKLAVNDAEGEAMEIAETAFTAAGDHNYEGAFNLASIPNGMYTFMVVAHTADGAVEERIVAMAITVEVGNFTPPEGFADPMVDILSVINTRGDAHSPSEINTQYVTGFPAIDDEVCVTLTVPNVSAGDVDVLIGDDLMSAVMMGALMVMDPDADNNISVCLDTSGLDEGMYSLMGAVIKPNGNVQFGLPAISVDRSAPMIEIVSPVEGHQVGSLPTVQVSYNDATGFDPEKRDPRAIEVTFTRLGSHREVATNPEMIRSVTAAGEVLTQSGNFSYTHDSPLSGGAYRIDVSVTDTLGNTATAESVEFTSEGVQATVSIVTPAPGQVVDPDQPLTISAALSGNGEIMVNEFLLNGTAADPTVENNLLTHTVDPDAVFDRGAGNTVTIKIEDEEGNTAEATSTFTLALDTTPPVVATYSPLGIIRTDRPIAAATVTDESGIKRDTLRIIIAGVPGNQGTGRRSSATSTTVTFTPSISVTPGPYTARVTVEDVHGNRTEVEWQFTVELDVTPPSITTSSPHGVIRSDKPIISVSASDDMSGVDTIEIGVKGEGNLAVEGVTSVRSDKTSATFTPTVALTSGTYTVDVKLADMSGNKASGQWQFTVELDTVAPSVLDTRPSQEHTENRRPTISATYTDAMSGVDVGSVKLTLNGAPVEPDSLSDTQVVYTPKADLPFGPQTVKLELSDMAPAANTAVQEWTFYVERVGIANARNYPNPFDHETTIAFRLSRQASITIRVYDFTGRLVAQPVVNSRYEAGEVKVHWHGETSAEDHLARGVYFCHILMEDNNFESQSAILKMAIISE